VYKWPCFNTDRQNLTCRLRLREYCINLQHATLINDRLCKHYEGTVRSLIKLNATVTSRLSVADAWLTAKSYKVFPYESCIAP
jgi:hypothetical protein